MISYIDSKNNKKVMHAYKLKNKNGIKEYHEFLIEGYKILELAVSSGLLKEVFTTKELDLPKHINQYIVKEDIIKKLSNSINPEGVIGVSSCLKEKAPQKMDKVVYLDDINDPGNMGTLIRTALAFNYDAVICSDNSCDIYNPKVISASKGAIFSIPILKGNLNKYKTNQIIISSTLHEKSIPLEKLKAPQSFFLVLGNEAHGIKKEIIDNSDILVNIPIQNIESLNVSIAGAILMYYLSL